MSRRLTMWHASVVENIPAVFREPPGCAQLSGKGVHPWEPYAAGPLDVFNKHQLQVMPGGNLAALATLALEVQHPLIASMVRASSAQQGHDGPIDAGSARVLNRSLGFCLR